MISMISINIKHISTHQIKTMLRFWFKATRCNTLMTSTKVTFFDAILIEHYVKGLEKLNFTKECIVIAVIS